MTVYCERKCRKRCGNICTMESIEIGKDGGCKGFTKIREYMREDNVVVFDDAGIPSIMVKFTRPKDGSEDRLFTVNGDLYDELYISKYKNCNINGLPYSLPHKEPWTSITLEEAEKACFEKGTGWHLMTAAEHGFLARMCQKYNTFPHGNTNRGEYHEDKSEKCELFDRYHMYTGTGPETWYHDHTIFGIDGLCGDAYEWMRGLRLMNGQLQYVKNNDAAAPIDLSRDSEEWLPMKYREHFIYISCEDGSVKITNEQPEEDCDGSRWLGVKNDFVKFPDEMVRLGLYAGDPDNYLYADTEGERLPYCGGSWYSTSYSGVFCVSLGGARSSSYGDLGFRSAFFKKKVTDKPETE